MHNNFRHSVVEVYYKKTAGTRHENYFGFGVSAVNSKKKDSNDFI